MDVFILVNSLRPGLSVALSPTVTGLYLKGLDSDEDPSYLVFELIAPIFSLGIPIDYWQRRRLNLSLSVRLVLEHKSGWATFSQDLGLGALISSFECLNLQNPGDITR